MRAWIVAFLLAGCDPVDTDDDCTTEARVSPCDVDKPVELLGSAAVFCGFCHASISERMREREAARAVPSVECHAKSVWFFVSKEIAWAGYFILAGAWSALVGCALFAAYPLWRRVWRRYHPLQATT